MVFVVKKKKRELSNHLMMNMRSSNRGIGDRFIPSSMRVSQLFVVDTHLNEDCGEQIGHTQNFINRFVTDIICCSMNITAFQSTARDPKAPGMLVMVATGASLRDGQTAKFPGPHDNCAFEKTASF